MKELYVIYNHKRYEQLKEHIQNGLFSPIYKSELKIKLNDMIRIKEFLIYYDYWRMNK